MARQFAIMAGLVLLCFVVLLSTVLPITYRYVLEQRQESLKENANFIALMSSISLARGYSLQSADLSAQLSFAAMMADSTLLICDVDGQVVYSTDGSTLGQYVGKRVPGGVVNSVVALNGWSNLTALGGLWEDERYTVGVPIYHHTYKDIVIGMVFIALESGSMHGLLGGLISLVFWCIILVLLVAFVGSLILSRYQSEPLRKMAQVAREYGHGNFAVRIPPLDRRDEIGDLTEAFNAMAQDLELSENRRRDLIANLSHELKTPLTTISGFTDGILDGTVPPEKINNSLEIISGESRRMSRLVRQMLDLSRLEQTGPESFTVLDIAEVLRQVLLSLESKIDSHGLDVDVDLPDDAVKVLGNVDALTQVCYNLLDNAIKFSPAGETIGISLTKQGQKAVITVKNQGPTIPPEELDRIFERFHKTDRSRSMDRDGVGLGLYIVKSILDNHRENITVTSEDGTTVFSFTLTLADRKGG